MLRLDPHPLAQLAAVTVGLPQPLQHLTSPDWLQALLKPDAPAPVKSSDELRGHVRDLLRHGGYKPTGRGKPASEYLLKAAQEGLTSINALVDVCNVVSLHSGLPISVVDIDRTAPPLHVKVAAVGASYVFNQAGQEIDLAGLLCLFDGHGPCANAVKDSQRTKTHAGTTEAVFVVWGSRKLASQVSSAADWAVELLHKLGAKAEQIPLHEPEGGEKAL